MKPRTKLHFEVLGFSKQLLDINHEMLEWAKKECLEHNGYMTKSRVICMDCGGRFSTDLVVRKKAKCPHCSAKLQVLNNNCRTNTQHIYVSKAIVFDEYQVVRNFEIYSHHKDGRNTRYYIMEILQHWINPNGKREVVARNHTLNNYFNSWNGNMEIRDKKEHAYWQGNKYDVYPCKIHPDSRFLNVYNRIGINHELSRVTILEAIRCIPNTPKLETLIKSKQHALLYHFKNCHIGNDYWTAIKICIRNNYIIRADAQTWVDYIDLLRYFNKDLHNAFYVCPKNLKQAHDKLVAKKRDIQKRQTIESQRTQIKADQKLYEKQKQKFFGIQFSKGNLTVKVLEHVKEFMDEGDTLKHCVFTNEYYKKPDSLVLSARIKDKPIETVEVSLTDLKIIQSRGISNKATEYHDDIINLVESNLPTIASFINN